MVRTPVYTSGDKVYTFNGTSELATVDNSDAIDFATNQEFTVAVWVKAESQQKYTGNSDNDVVEKWSGGEGYPYVIRYVNQTAGNDSGIIVAARYDRRNNPGVRSTSKSHMMGNSIMWLLCAVQRIIKETSLFILTAN